MESKRAVSLSQPSTHNVTRQRERTVVSARSFNAPRSLLAALAGIFFLLALACNLLIIVASVPDARGILLGVLAA